MKETIAILQTPAHPKRSACVSLLSEFLTQGIPGICFAMSLDKEPGRPRDEKVARTIQGLALGDDQSVKAVVQFLRHKAMPLAFEYFLEKKGLACQADNKPKGAACPRM